MSTTTKIADGIYFLSPEGSAWIAARFNDGKLVGTAEACNASTHVAANDAWAGIVPKDSDVVLDDEDTHIAIVRAVLGDRVDANMVDVSVMTTWQLELRDDQTSETVNFDERPTEREIREACEEWCKGGEWGNDGARIDVRWTLSQNDDEINEGTIWVEIEPNHERLIKDACGDAGCGSDPDDHDWTAEGEGGCDSNPGVWSTGGTAMSFATHCRVCGLRRLECTTGSQRNPGEHDTATYEMPDSWCADCQREECNCDE